jgi:DNA topoisomerase-1
MKILVISEKSNAAARIAYILSNATTKRKNMGGVQVFEFNREGDEYWVVGLRGHIIEIDYPEEFNDWNAIDPKQLVYAVPEKRVMAKNIISILTDLGKLADQIIIATDYDREGELIGLETVHLLGVDMSKVKRSKFSAFTKVEIEGAFSNLTDPDEKLAKAAESRQYIDLAWGAALTRFISLNSGQVGSNFLSVGRVQSPTLSLVVDRHREITSFVPEPYWNVNGNFFKETGFTGVHQKNPFKDEEAANAALTKVKDAKVGKVEKFEKKEKDEYPPAPFNTTMMMAEANKMGISPSMAMKLAEDLYTSGYISYPRTDNTVYPRSLSLKTILEKLRDSPFKTEAEEILRQESIRPSRGKIETTDHPPIYPTEAASPDKVKGDKWKIYELIVRRFFATVAPSARSEGIDVTVVVEGEPFDAKGYRILFEGWRKYYPYWRVTEVLLPEMTQGTEVEAKGFDVERKETLPLRRYSQGTLLQEMEKLGLGTKSTRHDIIQKLYDRKYAVGNDLIPTQSGIAVASALEKHAKIVTESKMTAHLEEDMENIATGKSTLPEVVEESQDMLSDILEVMDKNKQVIGDEIRQALHEQSFIGLCPACGGNLRVLRSRKGSEFIGCSGYPECKKAFPKPRGALVQTTDQLCEVCKLPKVRVIRRGSPPSVVCIDPECETNRDTTTVGQCPECGKDLRILYSRFGKRFIGCSGYPTCKRTYPLPQLGTVYSTGNKCETCGAPIMGVKGPRSWQFCANMDCASNKRAKKDKEGEGEEPKKAAAKKPVKKKAPAKKAASKKVAEVAKPGDVAPAKKPAVKKAAKKIPSKKKKVMTGE